MSYSNRELIKHMILMLFSVYPIYTGESSFVSCLAKREYSLVNSAEVQNVTLLGFLKN